MNNQYFRCYESHPALPVGDHVIYGGSCGMPIVKDADVYVALDAHWQPKLMPPYPWEPASPSNVIEFLYSITDMHAPKDPESFLKLIGWLAEQLAAGKKVHVGCIGGHGRTGTVFAALVKHVTGNEDAITFVREHYCKKAVESVAQIRFLHEHFGIKEVAGSKPVFDFSSKIESHRTKKQKVNKSNLHTVQSAPTELSGGKLIFEYPAQSVTPAKAKSLTIWGETVNPAPAPCLTNSTNLV